MNARVLSYRPNLSAGKPALVAALALTVLSLGPAAPHSAFDWFATLCGGTQRSGPLLSSGSLNTNGASASRPASVIKVLSCEALPNAPGKSITTITVDYAPLAFTPAHRHPGSVTAVVLQGTVRSQLGGGAAINYTVGQTWFEPPGTLHVFAENPDPVHPAKLLATFVADTGCGALVLPPD
ncbi:cupin domain-containing protein [Paraburkholderia bryophila]|uniref:Quercetin dioxygenase-like cupin family protein n=1 Tax=Paraburkholderia bryophila TaxID=420952 RepID=A0A329CP37_9BURK|nr:cupin domain-containing protein [Paraburkholderia bryophila]RAS35532.1 quercetin dioxygenase-like cupin family protein [Paraburkholderia bryophila]